MEIQHENLPGETKKSPITEAGNEPIKENAFTKIGKTTVSIIAFVLLTIIVACIMLTTGLGSAHPG